MQFDVHVGIDYSGAAMPSNRSAAIQVYRATDGLKPLKVLSPASAGSRRRNWNRAELTEWLQSCLAGEARIIVGMDHGFSFPLAYFQRYVKIAHQRMHP